jgi:phage terminase large subunit-like protein
MKSDYTTDFTAFYRDIYPVEGAFGPRPVILPYLETLLARSFPAPTGDPAAQNVLFSTSKKQGKSTLAGAVGLYLASRARYAEVAIIAADQDQSRDRVLKSIKYAVENHSVWNGCRVYRDIIELNNGSIIQAYPMDWRGAAGGNYSGVICDELHTYTLEYQRRLFDEMLPSPVVMAGVRWISSYAGFLDESLLLWEIWTRALAGERVDDELPIYHNQAASLLAFIDQGEASWRMPWSTPEYMEQIKQGERHATYRRLWLNEWTQNESRFIDPELWDACYSEELRPFSPGDNRMLVLGADASTSRDSTALVGVSFNQEMRTRDVIYSRIWKPVKDGKAKPTIDLDMTIKAEIIRLSKTGKVAAVLYDPYQLHAIATDLIKQGVHMIEFPQTNQRIESDMALHDAIVGRTIRHYGDPELTEHIRNASAKESPRGYRLDKTTTTRKIDGAVALSMAAFRAFDFGTPWDVY